MIKRGSSHLEMILAFVLFVGFTIFLLLYIRPYENNTLPDSILLRLQEGFREKTYTNLTVLFVKSNDSNCIKMDLSGFNASGESVTRNAVNDALVNSYVSADILSIESSASNVSYYVSVSPEFNSGGSYSCSNSEKNYKVGSVNTNILISNNLMNDFKNRYENDYDNLKSDLLIPATVDFSIVSGEYNLTRNIPDGVDVIAKTMTEEVLYSNGSIQIREFIFRIW